MPATPDSPYAQHNEQAAEPRQPARRDLELWTGDMAEADEYDRLQWLNATPEQRMQALEYIRALNYGYAEEDQPRPRFQRLYRVAELRGR